MRAAVVGSLVGKVAEMVTLLLLATVVPRALGPGAYGRFSVPLTLVTLGSLALTLGGPTLMARYVPSAPPDQRVALARAIGARLARGRALQVAVLAAGAAVAAVVFPRALPFGVTAMVVAALGLNVAATLVLQVGLGLGRTGAWSARYPLQNSVLIVAVLVLEPWAGDAGGVASILLAAMAGAGFAAVITSPVLRVSVDRVPVPPGAIRFGAFQAAGAALVQSSHRGPVLAVALLAGSDAETGYAALATGIALGVTYAVLQTFTVSLPHLAGRSSQDDDPECDLRRLAGGLLAVTIPAVVVVAVLIDELVPLVFGDGYADATAAFGPALALVVLAPVNALAVQAAALRFRPEVATMAGAAAAITFVVTAVAAVPAWGAAGGTAAALGGAAVSAAVSARRLPGAIGPLLFTTSFAGAAAVLALSLA